MSFNKVKLADICTAITYGYTASAKSEPDNAKFLRITDIQGGVVDWDSVPYCEITPDHVDKYRLSHGDIVVARTGNSTGENYLFESDEVAVYASYLIKYSVNKDIADPFFVWLQMRTPKWWSFINGAKGGSAQAGANAKVIGDFDVALPPLSIQKQIVSLVKPYYDKIANNKAMNQTLEKLAQRIFKSWFIDFDPVKANKEGLPFDGLSPEIQALFPSEFEDSELGMIPKGWSAGKFEDLAVSIATGGTPKRSETSYWNEGIVPWLSSSEVKNGIATSTKECITELGLSKSAAKLWVKNTVVIAMYGATAGEVCLLGLAMTTNQACCGLTPHEHSRSYLFLAARNEKTKLVSKASGAAQQNLNKGLIASHPYVIPSNDILVNFEKVVTPLIEKWMDNEFQNRTLSSLRNRLLPKLISGQISVGEATQELAEAV